MADASVSSISDDASSQSNTDTTSDPLSSKTETDPTFTVTPSLPLTQTLMSGNTRSTVSIGTTPSIDNVNITSSINSNVIINESTPSLSSTQSPVPPLSTQFTPHSQPPSTDVHTVSVNSPTPASEPLVTSTVSSIAHSLPQSVGTAPEGLGNTSSVSPVLNNPQANVTKPSVPLDVGSTPLIAGPAVLQSTTPSASNTHLLVAQGPVPTPTKPGNVVPVTSVGGQVVSAILTPITSVKPVGTAGGVTATTVSPKPALNVPLKVAKTVGATPLVKKVSLPVTGAKGSLPSTTNITLADILPHMIAMSSSSSPPGTGTSTPPLSNTPKTQVGKTGQTSSLLVSSGAKPGQGGSSVTVVTPKSIKTSSASTPTSSGGQGPSNTPLSKNDLQLLAFLQTNLPHLSHVQESIKSIIQNNIILQSMKSSLLPSTTATTVTGSTLLSPVKSTAQAPSSVSPVTLSIGTTSVPSSTVSVTTQLQRKPVLAQVIGSNSSLKNVSSSSVSPSLSSPSVVTATKEQPPTSAPSHGVKTTPPSSTRLLVSPGAASNQSQPSAQKGVSTVSTPPKANTTPMNTSPIPDLSLHMVPPSNLTPLDVDLDDVEMKEEPLDVGQPVVPLELPSFLADHTYCIYNPTVPSLPRQLPEYVVTIPSERLSYAPEVPDSPRTLFKLLKVLPKKVSGSSRPKSSTLKSFTPLGRIGK